MRMMLKNSDEGVVYWECRKSDENEIEYFIGLVGETGESAKINYTRFENLENIMEEWVEKKKDDGFAELDIMDLSTIVTVFNFDDGMERNALNLLEIASNAIEKKIRKNCTGIFDGGGFGMNGGDVFIYALDTELASQNIEEALQEEGILKEAKIMVLDETAKN